MNLILICQLLTLVFGVWHVRRGIARMNKGLDKDNLGKYYSGVAMTFLGVILTAVALAEWMGK